MAFGSTCGPERQSRTAASSDRDRRARARSGCRRAPVRFAREMRRECARATRRRSSGTSRSFIMARRGPVRTRTQPLVGRIGVADQARFPRQPRGGRCWRDRRVSPVMSSRSGTPAGKVDAAGIHRVRAHDAEQEGAVGTRAAHPWRSSCCTRFREAPVAPGQEAGEVGFEEGAAQHAIVDGMFGEQQHAAVPEARVWLASASQNAGRSPRGARPRTATASAQRRAPAVRRARCGCR